MPVSVPIQTSFNGGKFSARMKGRSDLDKYRFGCETLQNFIPTVQGAAVKRSGTRFIRANMDVNDRSRLIPFKVSEASSYVIELGAGVMRFYRDSGAVLEATQNIVGSPTAANPVSVEVTGHSYTTGQSVYITGSGMSEINGRFFEITVTGANTFTLDGENGTGRSTGTGGSVARHYEIKDGVSSNDLPWLESELDQIQYVQNGDLMYFAHPNHPPHEIIRTSDTSWTCLEMVFKFPPLETENNDEAKTVSIDDARASAGQTLTASGFTFSASDVGRTFAISNLPAADDGLWGPGADNALSLRVAGTNYGAGTPEYANHIQYEGRVYKNNGTGAGNFGLVAPSHEEGTQSDGKWDHVFVNWGTGYGEITAQASTTATITVNLHMPASVATGGSYNGSATSKWAWGAWDDVNGYPRSVAFFENRLWFGGTEAEPQTFWGSRSGIYNDFRITPGDLDDTGLQFTLLSDTLNGIEWMRGEDALFIGTTGGEFTVDSGSASKAITPSNIRVRRRSQYGTATNVQPITVESSLVFGRKTRAIHELTFDFNSDRYVAPDLTRFAHDIIQPNLRRLDYQADPFNLIWALSTDGSLACAAFVKTEDVIAWADVEIGGTNAVVESIAVIPHPDGDEDQLWVAVRRQINGGTVRYIEILEKFFDEDDDLQDGFFVDSGATYDGGATTTITGLWHLEGETVVVLADGTRQANKTVSSGAITITSASKVQVGLAMGSTRLRTLDWAPASANSLASPQGWWGRVNNLVFHVDRTGVGFEYGSDFSNTDEWPERGPSDSIGSFGGLYTGYSPVLDSPSGFEQRRRVAIRHDEPTPCTILAIVGKTEVESR